MKETWKNIKGYEGFYKISNFGRVESLYKNKILKSCISHNGYVEITLYKDKTKKRFAIHRLVAKAFIPNPDNKPEVNHIDNNPQNNHVSNLEWVTHKENVRHAWESGKMKSNLIGNTIRRKAVLLKKDGVIKKFKTMENAAKYIGVKQPRISMCASKNPRYKYYHKVKGWSVEII